MRHTLALAAVLAAALGTSSVAAASPCPLVMIVLDRSGSMDSDPSGGFSTPSRMDIAKMALTQLLDKYGDQIPFGLTSFTSDFSNCAAGVDILVEPANGTKAQVVSALAAVMTEGGTNTGQAIDKVVADPNMHDDYRPGSYILLITDGEPNCPGSNPSTDPEYTISAIQKANAAGIQTFVIGFGALPATAKTAMNQMAAAGGVPCTGTTCAGQQYYAAESAAALNAAIDSIALQIAGEFGGLCDDSCYSNGCPSAGEICVNSKCVQNPCATLNTCAPGDYCYTDGTSPGTCMRACTQGCAAGETCVAGNCQIDACAGLSCTTGQACRGGTCVTDQCAKEPCSIGMLCYEGRCIDDPCRYVMCPQNSECIAGTGFCAATGAGTGTGGGRGRAAPGGCHYGGVPHSHGEALLLVSALIALAWALRARRAV